MATQIMKTAFTAGELDPRLVRPEMEQYFYGADKLRNVFVQPQGGVRRRPASKFDAALTKYQSVTIETSTPNQTLFDFSGSFDIANAADIRVYGLEGEPDGMFGFVSWFDFILTTDYTVDVGADTLSLVGPMNQPGPADGGSFVQIVWTVGAQIPAVGRTDVVRYEDFSFSTQQEYLIVLLPFTLHVFKDVSGLMTLQTTIDTFFSNDDLTTVSFTQQLDSMLIFHKSRKTQHLQRQGSDTSWAISDWDYQKQAKRNFADTLPTSSGFEARVDQITDMRFSAGFPTNDVFTLKVGGEETNQIIYSTTPATLIPLMVAAIAALPNVGTPSITSTSSVAFRITMDDTDDQGKSFVFEEGTADFKTATNFINFLVNTKGQPIREDVWSVGGSTPRGYPRCGTFHQGRLWVAGSANLPQTLWGSRSGNVEDFDSSRVDDDYGIEIDGDTDSVTAFINLYSGRHLILLSDSAEFYVPTSDINIGITPTNISLRRTSRRGSKEGIRVVETDGAILFLQRGGRALRELLFDELETSYTTTDLATLAPHLLPSPKDMAYRSTIDLDNTNYIYVVDADGTMAVLNYQRKENVNAWILASTQGFYEAVATIQDKVYLAVAREIAQGTIEIFLETLDDNLLVDAGTQDSGVSVTSVSSGISHLNTQTVEIIVDGEFYGREVLSGGIINFVDLASNPLTVTSWQIGLPFPTVDDGDGEVWVRTMPLILQGEGGSSSFGDKIRVMSADFSLLDTRHLRVRHDFEEDVAAVDHEEQIFFDSFSNLDTYKLRVGGELTASITYSTTASTNETNIQAAIRNLTATSATGVTVAEFGSGNDEYRITFADDDGAVFWEISSESISGGGTVFLTTVDTGAAAIRAKDNLVSFQRLGGSLLDGQTPLFSGDKRLDGLLGWTRRGQISFTQEHAAEMNITNLSMKVRV